MNAIVIWPEEFLGNGRVVMLGDDSPAYWTEAWCIPAAFLVSRRDTQCD